MNTGPAPAYVGGACLLVGLALAFGAGYARQRVNDDLVASRLDALAGQVTGSVAARMQAFEYGLRGMRGLVVSQGGMPALDQVRRYGASRDIAQEFPGAHGFGLIWRVPAAEEGAFVARARAAGQPQFALRRVAPHDGDRFIILYVEPQAANQAAIGLDIASEPRRRAAALAAQATAGPPSPNRSPWCRSPGKGSAPSWCCCRSPRRRSAWPHRRRQRWGGAMRRSSSTRCWRH